MLIIENIKSFYSLQKLWTIKQPLIYRALVVYMNI